MVVLQWVSRQINFDFFNVFLQRVFQTVSNEKIIKEVNYYYKDKSSLIENITFSCGNSYRLNSLYLTRQSFLQRSLLR